MQFQTLLVLLSLGIQTLASPLEPVNVLEKRRDPTCTSYARANAFLTACPTATALCTSVLGRKVSTTTITHTSRVRSPPPFTVISRTPTATSTLTITSYTSTVTKNGVPAAINAASQSTSSYIYPSCRLSNQPASVVSGACSCLLDQTATVTTTLTTKHAPVPTTTIFYVSTTRTTTFEVKTTTV